MYHHDLRCERASASSLPEGQDPRGQVIDDHVAVFDRETLTVLGHPVMERWEDDYMRVLAGIAAQGGGSVLEVGFGMGISAGHLQSHAIEEHWIIEANADVLATARSFAASARSRVRLLHGFWEEVAPGLPDGGFDGILFDTYPLTADEIHRNHYPFFATAFRLLRPGGVLTYYSDEIAAFSADHVRALRDAGFERIDGQVCSVDPPRGCRYWTAKTILAPIVVKG